MNPQSPKSDGGGLTARMFPVLSSLYPYSVMRLCGSSSQRVDLLPYSLDLDWPVIRLSQQCAVAVMMGLFGFLALRSLVCPIFSPGVWSQPSQQAQGWRMKDCGRELSETAEASGPAFRAAESLLPLS